MGFSFGSLVALTYAALFLDVAARCIAIAARAVGEEEQGAEAEEEMERMLARHERPWYERRGPPGTTGPSGARRHRRGRNPGNDGRGAAATRRTPSVQGCAGSSSSWRREAESDLAAIKAWEGGLYQTTDLRPLLGDVRCPTLLLVGELDLICGPAHSGTIAEAIPHAEVVIVPDSGHFIPGEAPDAFREAVIAFCDA